jgi:histidinol-phosphate aminotransferase
MIPPNEHLLKIERTSERMGERGDFVCLDRNERTLPLPAHSLREMLSAISSELVNRYPNPEPLYDRLSRVLELPTENLYLTNGSDAAIRMLFQAYVRPGDAVVRAEPSYAMYGIYTKIFQGREELVGYGSDLRLDLESLLNRVNQRPRLLVLANPDQPTGAVIPREAMRRLAEATQRNGVLLIIDEAYFPFYSETAISWVKEFDHLAVTRSFSKAGGLAGLRLGYFAASRPIIRAVGQLRGAHEVNAMAIAMGSYMIDHPEVSQDYLRQMDQGRTVLRQAAEQLNLDFPACPANFQLLGFPGLDSTDRIVGELKARGYLVKGGFGYPALERFIRVTLADTATLIGFVEALKAVVKEAAWTPR